MKPSIPKGTRDFSPGELMKRNYIFDTIKSVFLLYGYQPLETPAMENLSTLLGKYGDEGDKFLFRILNSGDFLSSVADDDLLSRETGRLSSQICERGLRYDLTVPFARYVVQHRDEIIFPFKRYQIQPVWRADRPQKGRYREFYQCDVDVIGSDSLLNEFELVRIIVEIFRSLQISVTIKINNRKILTGIAEVINESARITDITVAIDKLDKIGPEKVNEELAERGLDTEAIAKLQPIINLKGSNAAKLEQISLVLSASEEGMKGIAETTEILSMVEAMEIKCRVELDLTLARGLNYYTGAIIEVKADGLAMGSISGGGRYDNLTGIFGLPGISGVGISFGADRIYDVMNELNIFPEETASSTRVMFVNFGGEEEILCLKLAASLRNKGINTEVFPENTKIKKQFSYADSKQIPFVVIIGESERQKGECLLKNMKTGDQTVISPDQLIQSIGTL